MIDINYIINSMPQAKKRRLRIVRDKDYDRYRLESANILKSHGVPVNETTLCDFDWKLLMVTASHNSHWMD